MIAIPKALRTNERDRRGYPIPFIVMRDKQGLPHFTISDAERVMRCISKRLCGLCGKRMTDGAWFIGGPRCFTDPRGAFLDPPSHEACARFAIATCPYLAVARYARRIDDKTLAPDATPEGVRIAKVEEMPDARPEMFGLGRATAYRAMPGNEPGSWLLVASGWETIEYWRHGARVDPLAE